MEFRSGFDPILNRPISMRKIPSRVRANPECYERWVRAARPLARLSHPYLLGLYDVHSEGVVCEHVGEAVCLRDFLAIPNDRRAFGASLQGPFWSQLLGGLNHAHNQGVVHKSLTPDSIWLFPDRSLRLWGFGLLYVEAGQRVTLSQLDGNLAFMSPEQCRGERADARSDIWQVGVLMHLMMTGSVPFRATSLPYLVRSILSDDVSLVEGLPKRHEAVMMRCLQKDPAQRFPSAAAVLTALFDDEVLGAEEALLHHRLARNYYRQGRYELAILEWGKASAIAPAEVAYWNNLGAAHFMAGDVEAAREWFRKVGAEGASEPQLMDPPGA